MEVPDPPNEVREHCLCEFGVFGRVERGLELEGSGEAIGEGFFELGDFLSEEVGCGVGVVVSFVGG